MRITKQSVDKLSIPISTKPGVTAQKRYYDDILRCFGIRVTSGGTKAFFIEKNVNHKLRRITIGHYPELTVEMARKEAQKLLGKIATGIDPIAEKHQLKVKSVTLIEVFKDYLDARKSLKILTITDYKRLMNEAFADWHQKPILSITKDKVAEKHSTLGQRSQARANLAMRLLRALFYFAKGKYEDFQGRSIILENPVSRLSHTRAWYKIERRRSIVKHHELRAWYQAVMHIPETHISSHAETFRDYLLLILFTGLRREEAAKLTWNQVDFKSRTITIVDTKNHEPHTLPMSDYLLNMVQARRSNTQSTFVFPGSGKQGYVVEPRKAMQKVTSISGVSFTLHDLRRTFITIAESLDIPAYALKNLLNHKSNQDVTAGYIVMDVERLRIPMNKITDFILRMVDQNNTQCVISFNPSKITLEDHYGKK